MGPFIEFVPSTGMAPFVNPPLREELSMSPHSLYIGILRKVVPELNCETPHFYQIYLTDFRGYATNIRWSFNSGLNGLSESSEFINWLVPGELPKPRSSFFVLALYKIDGFTCICGSVAADWEIIKICVNNAVMQVDPALRRNSVTSSQKAWIVGVFGGLSRNGMLPFQTEEGITNFIDRMDGLNAFIARDPSCVGTQFPTLRLS